MAIWLRIPSLPKGKPHVINRASEAKRETGHLKLNLLFPAQILHICIAIIKWLSTLSIGLRSWQHQIDEKLYWKHKPYITIQQTQALMYARRATATSKQQKRFLYQVHSP